MFFKTITLNAVLNHLHTSQDSSIMEYFYLKGTKDEKVIGDCRNELKKGGHIIYYTIPSYGIKETITDTGLNFIANGGYDGKMQEAIDNEERSKVVMKAALKLLKSPKNENKPLIIQNKFKIEYALEELVHLSDLLSSTKSFSPPKLRGYISNIRTISEGVFLPEHKFFSAFKNIHINQEEVSQICDNAIHFLEFELIDLKTNLNGIHPKVIEASAQLYLDGHYREAIASAFGLVIEDTKTKFPVKGKNDKLLDGRPLMEQVFSPDNPVYSISDEVDYREGWKLLFAGSVSALRNKYIHKQSKINDPEYTLNLLHFASSLIRIIDDKAIY